MANERLNRRRLKGISGALCVPAAALLIGAWTPATAGAQAHAKKSPVRKHAAHAAATPSRPQAESPVSEAGRRDPFKLPPPPGNGNGEPGFTGPLPPGKKGLVISQLRLEGIVREDKSNSMIAVVTNATDRAYFLREKDEVYNGVVSKITPDSVYFTENAMQSNGSVLSHEVVKKLGSAPGEGR